MDREWIPIEALPPETIDGVSDLLYVTVETGQGEPFTCLATLHVGDGHELWTNDVGDPLIGDVTAHMRAPAPYRAKARA